MRERYENQPLGLSSGPSRFGPIATPIEVVATASSFGVLYMAADLATATYETLIRDRYDLEPSRILLPEDYRGRVAVNISTSLGATFTLVDLTDGNAIRYGVPSDVTNYSAHSDGLCFATFVHAYMPTVDGVLYRSRFTNRRNIAVFDRANERLATGATLPLTRDLLSSAISSWNVTVI